MSKSSSHHFRQSLTYVKPETPAFLQRIYNEQKPKVEREERERPDQEEELPVVVDVGKEVSGRDVDQWKEQQRKELGKEDKLNEKSENRTNEKKNEKWKSRNAQSKLVFTSNVSSRSEPVDRKRRIVVTAEDDEDDEELKVNFSTKKHMK